MNITDFRKNISKELDRALAGGNVTIERGGVIFTIVPSVITKKPPKTRKEVPM